MAGSVDKEDGKHDVLDIFEEEVKEIPTDGIAFFDLLIHEILKKCSLIVVLN